MAYRFETNQAGDPEIVIDGWEKGIAASPYLGIADMRGFNINYIPGAAYMNSVLFITQNSSAQPTYAVQDKQYPSNVYFQNADGTIQQTIDGGVTITNVTNPSLSAANGNGLAIFKGYLFAFRDANIDYIQITSTGTTGGWTNSWQSFSSNFPLMPHQALWSVVDDVLYFCNGQYVGSLKEVPGSTFAPGTPATYNFNERALNLPTFNNQLGSCARWIEDLGINLMIAAGTSIYPWNRTDPSFKIPLIGPELIYKLLNINNTIYIFAGSKANIYSTSGYSVEFFAKVPDYLSGVLGTGEAINWVWGGVMSHQGRLFFGLSYNDSAAGGIYSINLQSKALCFECRNNSSFSARASVLIPLDNYSVTPSGFITGFVDGSSKGYSTLSTTASVSSIGNYIESDMVPVGLNERPKTFSQIEIKFLEPLILNETFTIASRKSMSDTYVSITGTITASSGNTSVSYVYPFNSENFEWIQVKANFASVSSGSRCKLKEIRIR